MKGFKRFVALALCIVCLVGCGSELEALPPEENGLTVAYVPLDDRPVNDERVVYLADSLGLECLVPERVLYHTALDHQETNSNGSQYGNRGALWDWVKQQDEAGCDVFVLSLDQLFSGGLVNSRSIHASSPIAFADGRSLSAEEVMEQYLLPLMADDNNQVYLIDTVMRLAPTVGYEGFGLEEYHTLRDYAMLPRPALDGDALTVENIVASYPLGDDGKEIKPDASLSEAMLENYFASRARKLRLADTLLTQTEGMYNVHWLMGVDDSAPSNSIQTSELDYLRQKIGGRGSVLSGADEDGMLAFCRLYADLVYEGTMPTATVRYFGGSEANASSDYDHQPMTDVVDEHLAYLGVAQSQQGDLEILVLTAPAVGYEEDWQNLIEAINENEKKGIPTVLMDAAKHAYGTTVQEKLIEDTNLGTLFGYGGYYDLANVTGVSVANGVARWLCLAQEGSVSMAQNKAFARTLADSLLKDLCYKHDGKVALTLYVKNELLGDPDNFAKTDLDETLTQNALVGFMEQATIEVEKNLEHSNLMVSLEPTWMGWGDVLLQRFESPWQRVFEVRYDIVLEDFGNAHEAFWIF